jgi:hypothetical protein
MRTALTDLAERLWTDALPWLTIDDLTAVAGPLTAVPGAHRLQPEQAAHLLGSGTLLVRVGDGQFDFAHRSLMEWLVTERIAKLLATGEHTAVDRHLTPSLSPVQIDLLDELAGRDQVAAWVRAAINHPDDGIRANAIAMSQHLDITIVQRLILRGQDLRGQDLTGRNLAGADLTGADLTDAAPAENLIRAAQAACSYS